MKTAEAVRQTRDLFRTQGVLAASVWNREMFYEQLEALVNFGGADPAQIAHVRSRVPAIRHAYAALAANDMPEIETARRSLISVGGPNGSTELCIAREMALFDIYGYILGTVRDTQWRQWKTAMTRLLSRG